MAFRAYRMSLKQEHISDYRDIHRRENIWPEIVRCLTRSGMDRMIIFQDGRNLLLFEEADDLDESYRIQCSDPMTRKWDALVSSWMEKYPSMEGLDASDLEFEEIEIVYYFEHGQLKH